MSSHIVPFESAKLPSHVSSLFQVERLGAGSGTSGFPVVSIKGKVFTKVSGGERELITKGDDGEPASSIDVVIVGRNPHRSKVFYATGYVEGSDAKPTCYSNNGLSPEADAAEPQAKKCATCAHNQWGSRISEAGSKGKACADSHRLAIATPGAIGDSMLLRVPAASLKALDTFGDTLVKRGVPYQMVLTKIGFDYTVAHPALTFKPIGFIDEATALEVSEAGKSDLVQQIIGLQATPSDAMLEEPKAEAKAPAIEKPKKAVIAVEEDDEPAPKAKPVEVEEAPAPKKAKVIVEASDDDEVEEAPKPKKAAVVVESKGGSLEDDIASVMSSLEWDDE